jgi:hypothetical protein
MYSKPPNRSNRYNFYNSFNIENCDSIESFPPFRGPEPCCTSDIVPANVIDASIINESNIDGASTEYNNIITECLLQTIEIDLKHKNQLLLKHTDALMAADSHINDRNNTIHILKQIIIDKNNRIIELEQIINKSIMDASLTKMDTDEKNNASTTHFTVQLYKIENFYKKHTDSLKMKIIELQNELSHRIISSLEYKFKN